MSTVPPPLADCGCCESIGAQTPAVVENRTGLPVIAYRVGTHARFKATMLANLARHPELGRLRTRRDDDFAIALLDAWATVADVLTLYQERIANESYLRTATERLSVLELGRLIGYELRPGVAASTLLAFTLESAEGAPRRTTLDVGTRVQSVPDPGQEAQTFETVERIEARPAWNEMRPRLSEPQAIKGAATKLVFEGITTNLRPGDVLLFYDDAKEAHLGSVTGVTLEPPREPTRTRVALGHVLSKPSSHRFAGASGAGSWTGAFANRYPDAPTKPAQDLVTEAKEKGFAVQELFDNLAASRAVAPKAYVFRSRAGAFGHNAPRWSQLPRTLRAGPPRGPYADRRDTWVETTVADLGFYLETFADEPLESNPAILSVPKKERPKISAIAASEKIVETAPLSAEFTAVLALNRPYHIYLERVVQGVAEEQAVVLQESGFWAVETLKAISDVSVADFTLSGKVTRLTFEADYNPAAAEFGVRTTTIYVQPEALALARVPRTDPVASGNPTPLELDGWFDGLAKGQTIVISGELDDAPGTFATERATIDLVEHKLHPEVGGTCITLQTALKNAYLRETVRINGNVARATHGETVSEILGSGDATAPFQRFALRQPPLTYVSSATGTGGESTLEVRIDDVEWHEVPYLYKRGAGDPIFATRRGDDGKTTLVFGDGLTGARLPSGTENVRATYRKGIGRAGNLVAGQLTQLLDRPLGVRAVRNPLATSGGDDPETRDDARGSAPLQVKTLDRLVSLQDYEDFARAFSGIAKALATWTWDGHRLGIFLTIAGPGGAPIAPDDDVYKSLIAAMAGRHEDFVTVVVQTYDRRFFAVRAGIRIDPDHSEEKVLADARTALRNRFAFEARAFGQPVALSEVYAVLHGVPGITAVDIDALYLSTDGPPTLPSPPPERLVAALPRAGETEPEPAQLLMLDDARPDLTVMP